MPKTVLIATAISAISPVSRNACTASGALIASQNARPALLERARDDQQQRHRDQDPDVQHGDRAQAEPRPPGRGRRWAGGRPDGAQPRRAAQRCSRSSPPMTRTRPPAARSPSRRRRPGCRPGSGCTRTSRTSGSGRAGRRSARPSRTRPSPGRRPAPCRPRRAGRIAGSTIRRNVVSGPAPERRRRLLDVGLHRHQHRLHGPHHERQRHEQQRDDDAGPRAVEVDADRDSRCRTGCS